MKVNQLLLTLLLCSLFSYAQQPYYNERPEFLKANSVWAFGENAGLDFNSGSPVGIHTEMITNEGCASVADPVTGKLLFYSNGGEVWNAIHQVMPNGRGLLGNANRATSGYGRYSTTQGVCIVPVIGTSDKYYLFSLSGPTASGPKVYDSVNNLTATLFYNIVDMSLNNGLGDIVAGQKNIPLNKVNLLSEAMIAIPGENCDIWLLVYAYDNHDFMAYHITGDGIDTMPVMTPSGANQGRNAGSSLAVSPDRQMIAITSIFPDATLLGKFNTSTGAVTNVLRLLGPAHYGVCFSPDGSKLYMNAQEIYTPPGGSPGVIVPVYQYDLSSYNANAISSSEQQIGMSPYSAGKSFLFSYRLYNGKIFATGGQFNDSMHVINEPNLAGAACDFRANVILLSPNTNGRFDLGNDVVFPLYPDTISMVVMDTTICPNQHLALRPVNDHHIQHIWDDGTTQPERVIEKEGIYWLIQSDGCYSYVDTFIVRAVDFPKPVINVNEMELGIAGSFNYDSYQWFLNESIISGATDRNYTVSENGDYQVVVSNGQCTDTSEVYKVTNADESGIANYNILAEQIRIYPNPTNSLVYIKAPVKINLSLCSIQGKILKQLKNENRVSLHDLADGLYFLLVYDHDGRLIKTEKIKKKF